MIKSHMWLVVTMLDITGLKYTRNSFKSIIITPNINSYRTIGKGYEYVIYSKENTSKIQRCSKSLLIRKNMK